MKTQCINCKHAAKPTMRSACNNKGLKYPLIDFTEMKYNGSGDSYCDDFKPNHKGRK